MKPCTKLLDWSDNDVLSLTHPGLKNFIVLSMADDVRSNYPPWRGTFDLGQDILPNRRTLAIPLRNGGTSILAKGLVLVNLSFEKGS
jgi:hypothetical protein